MPTAVPPRRAVPMRDARRHPGPILAPFLAMLTTLGLIGLPMGASPIQTPAPQQNPPQQHNERSVPESAPPNPRSNFRSESQFNAAPAYRAPSYDSGTHWRQSYSGTERAAEPSQGRFYSAPQQASPAFERQDSGRSNPSPGGQWSSGRPAPEGNSSNRDNGRHR